MHFHEWKLLYFDSNFTAVCSQGSTQQLVSIGSGNGLAPNRRQAITWTNAYPVHWRIYAALLHGETTEEGNRRYFFHCPTVLLEDNDLFILNRQCNGCWWLGDRRSQGISSNGIGLVIPEYSGFNISSQIEFDVFLYWQLYSYVRTLINNVKWTHLNKS